MKNLYQKELTILKQKKYVDKKILREFIERLNQGEPTQIENPLDHFCTFFVPINIQSRSVYLGHHIKADTWLPPGGHVEKSESPISTVLREMKEELGINKNHYKIELFDISITQVIDKKRLCKTHYDFWYLIHTPNLSFSFDRSEFFQAEWLLIDLAIDRVTQKTVLVGLNKLKNLVDGL